LVLTWTWVICSVSFAFHWILSVDAPKLVRRYAYVALVVDIV
jgi:hypothetical protein